MIQFEDLPAECESVKWAKMYLNFAYAHKDSFSSISNVLYISRDIAIHQEWVESQVSRDNRKTGEPWSAPYMALNGSDASYVQDTITIYIGRPSGYVEFDITEAMRNWKSGQPS